MNEENFHKLGDVLDELDKLLKDAGVYKSDMLSAYSDLDDVYNAIKDDYGYKDNSDMEQIMEITREVQTTMIAIQSINHKIPDIELRDLFAMHALNGLMVQSEAMSDPEFWNYDTIACIAYEAADAMIEARKKNKK